MKKIVLLDIDKPKSGKYQFFLDWFKSAWIYAGGEIKLKTQFPFIIRLVAAKLKLGRKTPLTNKKKALLVIGGAYLDYSAFPYNFFYETIPVFWDTWLKYHPLLISSLKRNKVKYAFFTQREVAERIQKIIPEIKTFWVPEGIEVRLYKKGEKLKERKIDILQYGRKFEKYHRVILNTVTPSHKYLFSNNDLDKVFNSFSDLTTGLSNSKISICFPRSFTHPEITGSIETLTQRYWESILSGCLIIGKGPQELIDLMGYNPVVDVDWNNPEKQLRNILENIDEYQNFVDKNYEKALEICSWENRVSQVINILRELEYEI
jgi:hypothetical protein